MDGKLKEILNSFPDLNLVKPIEEQDIDSIGLITLAILIEEIIETDIPADFWKYSIESIIDGAKQ